MVVPVMELILGLLRENRRIPFTSPLLGFIPPPIIPMAPGSYYMPMPTVQLPIMPTLFPLILHPIIHLAHHHNSLLVYPQAGYVHRLGGSQLHT
jgi:hypothetical protein